MNNKSIFYTRMPVSLTLEQHQNLLKFSKKHNRSAAALVREAVNYYLALAKNLQPLDL